MADHGLVGLTCYFFLFLFYLFLCLFAFFFLSVFFFFVSFIYFILNCDSLFGEFNILFRLLLFFSFFLFLIFFSFFRLLTFVSVYSSLFLFSGRITDRESCSDSI